MTDRCTIIDHPDGSYCVSCVDQPFIPHIPEHVNDVDVAAWNAGADMWDDTNNIPLVIDGPCEFQFTVPMNPVGLFMGFFDGTLARNRIDPASLFAVYLTTENGQIVAQAYRYGVPFGAAHGVSAGDTIKGQRVGVGVNFLAAGTVFARGFISPGVTSCGACLFHSGDNIPAADFHALTAPPSYGAGSNVISFSQRGNQDSNSGLNLVRFSQTGRSPPHGESILRFSQRGNQHSNSGFNTLRFQQFGAGDIITPSINGGTNMISFSQQGTATYPYYMAGENVIRFSQRGNQHSNSGLNTISFGQTGTTDDMLQDYIVAFMSPGISQIIFGYDHYTLEDGIAFQDGVATRLSILLRETIALSGQLGTMAALHVVMRDGLQLDDKFIFHFLATLTDTVQLGDALAIQQSLTLLDTLVLNGTLPTSLDALALLTTTLVLRDALDKRFAYNLDDEIDLNDTLMIAWRQIFELVDSIEFSDTLDTKMSLVMLIPDTIALDGDFATQLASVFAMADEIGFALRVRINDGLFIGYAMNTESRGATKYLDWNHNSYARVGNRFFAGSDNGLLAVFEGADDAGENIDSFLRTALEALGTSSLKKMTKAYLGIRTDGTMLLGIEYTSKGRKLRETYRANPVLAEDFRETNVDIGNNMKSVYWAFELSNEEGSDFTLDAIKVIPLICEERANG